MSPETWCYIFVGGLTAMIASRLLAIGRAAVQLEAEQAREASRAASRRRAALIANLEMAGSDVTVVEE